MRREAGFRCDRVVVPDAQLAPIRASWVVVLGEREMMFGIKPTVVGTAESVEGTKFNHARLSIILLSASPLERPEITINLVTTTSPVLDPCSVTGPAAYGAGVC